MDDVPDVEKKLRPWHGKWWYHFFQGFKVWTYTPKEVGVNIASTISSYTTAGFIAFFPVIKTFMLKVWTTCVVFLAFFKA